MAVVTWMFFCLVAIDVCFVGNAQNCQKNGNSYNGSCRWNGEVNGSAWSSGSDSNQPCYNWGRSFSETRDVLLRLNVILGVNVSLQIIKYMDTATSVLVGELKGCAVSPKLEIALANCTGFALNFVGKPCSNSSQAAMTFYSTPYASSFSSVESDSCRRSPCSANSSCLELTDTDNMGYRCYCKDWFRTSCLPGPLHSSGNNESCHCPKTHYVGEICKLNESVSCPSGNTTNGSSCYGLVFSKKSWDSAEADCKARGGHLTSIHSDSENHFVDNLTESFSFRSVWIGLNRRHINVSFVWSDGTNSSYRNWLPEEPGDRGHCVKLRVSKGEWRASSCSNVNSYVCKYPFTPSSSTPATQVTTTFSLITTTATTRQKQTGIATTAATKTKAATETTAVLISGASSTVGKPTASTTTTVPTAAFSTARKPTVSLLTTDTSMHTLATQPSTRKTTSSFQRDVVTTRSSTTSRQIRGPTSDTVGLRVTSDSATTVTKSITTSNVLTGDTDETTTLTDHAIETTQNGTQRRGHVHVSSDNSLGLYIGAALGSIVFTVVVCILMGLVIRRRRRQHAISGLHLPIEMNSLSTNELQANALYGSSKTARNNELFGIDNLVADSKGRGRESTSALYESIERQTRTTRRLSENPIYGTA